MTNGTNIAPNDTYPSLEESMNIAWEEFFEELHFSSNVQVNKESIVFEGPESQIMTC